MNKHDGVHGMAEGYQSEVTGLRRRLATLEAARDHPTGGEPRVSDSIHTAAQQLRQRLAGLQIVRVAYQAKPSPEVLSEVLNACQGVAASGYVLAELVDPDLPPPPQPERG